MRYLLLILLLLTFDAHATKKENSQLDSLHYKLNTSVSESARTDALIGLYNYHYSVNSDSALYYATESLETSNKSNYLEGKIKSITNIGSTYFYRGEYGNALKYYLESNDFIDIYISKNGKDAFAKTQLSKNLNNIGLINLNQQNYGEAEA